MDTDPDSVRERAVVTHAEPPLYDVDEPLWSAEDPETNCVGYGRVEAEAMGNLIAVVVERADTSDTGHAKMPGEVMERTWQDSSESIVSKFTDVF
jgi:hypothetical protein